MGRLRYSPLILLAPCMVTGTVANANPSERPAAGAAQLSPSVPAAESPLLDGIERVAKSAEDWELKGESVLSGESHASDLRTANKRLSDYLRLHPSDVRALLLQTRVLRALIVVTPVEVKLDDSGSGRITKGDTSGLQSDALVAVGKVIAADPNNADAYYWKARTLMLSNPVAEQVSAEEAFDPRPAIDAARMAVRLAPESTAYREYFAFGLFGIGQTSEALQELRKLPTKHPVLQLMDDMAAVPVPERGERENDTNDVVRALFSGHMDTFKYAGLRVRLQSIPSSPAQAKAFYAGTWPRIHWVKVGDHGDVAAGLVWRDNKLEPIADPTLFTGNFDQQLPPSGVLLLISQDEEAKPRQTKIFTVNFRRY